MRRRVVLTGIGCATPLGCGVEGLWDALLRGQSGVGPITLFDAGTFPVRIAAEVQGWDCSQTAQIPACCPRLPRQTHFAVFAAQQALQRAGLPLAELDPRRLGVSLGCGEVFPDLEVLGSLVAESLLEGGLDQGELMRRALLVSQRCDELAFEPGAAAGLVAGWLDAQGPAFNFTTSCISSTIALGAALEAIRRDDADVMLAGGAHSMVHPLGISGFYRLSTLSTRNDEPQRASRPFERDRDGFVVGEGAAVVVLEELEHARRRGAEVWAELTGFASTHDAYRFSDPRPDGEQAARCMTLALRDAAIDAMDIDYINAHGSGTPANDVAETVAIKRALGAGARRVPVSSTKSMTGHLTTACGALELVICALAVRHGAIPPTINFDHPDPLCDLDYVPNTARQLACRHAVNNSFGFGGQNAVMVVSRYAG
ncbi:MAG: beta-ketoacyl-[acyl-carrier-protein] synthase family protein [Pirellulaceae bacterium]|nr:beta-ketoacyl-[acyl-carrier-protein] synthase family protein [Pirellulaceae bacterium]